MATVGEQTGAAFLAEARKFHDFVREELDAWAKFRARFANKFLNPERAGTPVTSFYAAVAGEGHFVAQRNSNRKNLIIWNEGNSACLLGLGDRQCTANEFAFRIGSLVGWSTAQYCPGYDGAVSIFFAQATGGGPMVTEIL